MADPNQSSASLLARLLSPLQQLKSHKQSESAVIDIAIESRSRRYGTGDELSMGARPLAQHQSHNYESAESDAFSTDSELDIVHGNDKDYNDDFGQAVSGDGGWDAGPGRRLRSWLVISVIAGSVAAASVAAIQFSKHDSGGDGVLVSDGDVDLGFKVRRGARRDWVRDEGALSRARRSPGGFVHEDADGFVRDAKIWAESEFASKSLKKSPKKHKWGLLGALEALSSLNAGIEGVKWDPTAVVDANGDALPADFDVREKWPHCADLINDVVDQGNCGSCWAVAPAKVMSERLCIASGGKEKAHLSAQQLLSCGGLKLDGKSFESQDYMGGTCDGGFPTDAYARAFASGLVTGGLFGDKGSCMPYAFKPCKHPCEAGLDAQCSLRCAGSKPVQSVFKIKKLISCANHDFNCLALELLHNGPMSTFAGTIYDEFYAYKSGVYMMSEDVSSRGSSHGGHVIEIIGWGTRPDGLVYWKVYNSWLNWGDKGYGEIAVGELRIGEALEAAEMEPQSVATTSSGA